MLSVYFIVFKLAVSKCDIKLTVVDHENAAGRMTALRGLSWGTSAVNCCRLMCVVTPHLDRQKV